MNKDAPKPVFPFPTLRCIDRHHPLKVRENWQELNKGRNQKRYAKYMRNQVTELLTQYGKIDIIWFDFSYPATLPSGPGKSHEDWESEKLIKLVRKLQPNIIVNNRLDLPGSADIETPEQYTPLKDKVDEKGNHKVWEGCLALYGQEVVSYMFQKAFIFPSLFNRISV